MGKSRNCKATVSVATRKKANEMYRVEVHRQIRLIIFLFYKMGLWQGDREPTTKERLWKWFCSIGYFSLIISFSVGAWQSVGTEDKIFLAESALAAFVLWVKLNFLIWKGAADMRHLLHEVCVYTTDDHNGFTSVTDRMKKFTEFITVLITISCFTCVYAVVISPFIGIGSKALFFNIAFPLDHKNDDIAFWIAFAYLALFAMIPSMIGLIFNMLMWYLLFSCALRYKLLERQIANVGHNALNQKLSVIDKNNLYDEGLKGAIRSHASAKECAAQLESFFSRIFMTSFVTSGVGICGSLYCLVAFHRSTNVSGQFVLLAILLYSIFDVFMLTYFGNEIKLSSDRLMYCLFESNWMDQPKSTKKSLQIFGELLMRPYEIFVFEVYPLNLDTFTRILRSAYNMFNILQNLQ